MPPLGGGFNGRCLGNPLLWRGWQGGLFVCLLEKVCDVYNGILMYVFHEGFDSRFRDF